MLFPTPPARLARVACLAGGRSASGGGEISRRAPAKPRPRRLGSKRFKSKTSLSTAALTPKTTGRTGSEVIGRRTYESTFLLCGVFVGLAHTILEDKPKWLAALTAKTAATQEGSEVKLAIGHQSYGVWALHAHGVGRHA